MPLDKRYVDETMGTTQTTTIFMPGDFVFDPIGGPGLVVAIATTFSNGHRPLKVRFWCGSHTFYHMDGRREHFQRHRRIMTEQEAYASGFSIRDELAEFIHEFEDVKHFFDENNAHSLRAE